MKRVHLAYPEDWDELTEDEKHEAAYQMALVIQAELGYGPSKEKDG